MFSEHFVSGGGSVFDPQKALANTERGRDFFFTSQGARLAGVKKLGPYPVPPEGVQATLWPFKNLRPEVTKYR